MGRSGALVVLLGAGLAGCEHAVWGNGTAVMLTLGLFFGTLQLGRRLPTPSAAGEAVSLVAGVAGVAGQAGRRGGAEVSGATTILGTDT